MLFTPVYTLYVLLSRTINHLNTKSTFMIHIASSVSLAHKMSRKPVVGWFVDLYHVKYCIRTGLMCFGSQVSYPGNCYQRNNKLCVGCCQQCSESRTSNQKGILHDLFSICISGSQPPSFTRLVLLSKKCRKIERKKFMVHFLQLS